MPTSQTTNILPLILRVLAGEQVDGFPMLLPPPVATTVGFEVVAVEHGAAVFSLDIQRQKNANPMGTVHGGGWSLARKLDDVTLADVYDALGLSAPFNIAHQQESPKCLHERAANRALAEALAEAEALL